MHNLALPTMAHLPEQAALLPLTLRRTGPLRESPRASSSSWVIHQPSQTRVNFYWPARSPAAYKLHAASSPHPPTAFAGRMTSLEPTVISAHLVPQPPRDRRVDAPFAGELFLTHIQFCGCLYPHSYPPTRRPNHPAYSHPVWRSTLDVRRSRRALHLVAPWSMTC